MQAAQAYRFIIQLVLYAGQFLFCLPALRNISKNHDNARNTIGILNRCGTIIDWNDAAVVCGAFAKDLAYGTLDLGPCFLIANVEYLIERAAFRIFLSPSR